MALYPRQFVKFLDGRLGSDVIIAQLPGAIGAHCHVLSTEVRIAVDYARKIQQKHKLRYEHFSMIQPAIDNGWCWRSPDKPDHLEFALVDERIFGAKFLLVLKIVRSRDEIWLASFYRTKNAQIKSKLKRARARGTLIREHVW